MVKGKPPPCWPTRWAARSAPDGPTTAGPALRRPRRGAGGAAPAVDAADGVGGAFVIEGEAGVGKSRFAREALAATPTSGSSSRCGASRTRSPSGRAVGVTFPLRALRDPVRACSGWSGATRPSMASQLPRPLGRSSPGSCPCSRCSARSPTCGPLDARGGRASSPASVRTVWPRPCCASSHAAPRPAGRRRRGRAMGGRGLGPPARQRGRGAASASDERSWPSCRAPAGGFTPARGRRAVSRSPPSRTARPRCLGGHRRRAATSPRRRLDRRPGGRQPALPRGDAADRRPHRERRGPAGLAGRGRSARRSTACSPRARRLLRTAVGPRSQLPAGDARDVLPAGRRACVLGRGPRGRAARFLVPEGDRWRFTQGIVRDVAYEGLSYRRRRELHLRAGEATERRAGSTRNRWPRCSPSTTPRRRTTPGRGATHGSPPSGPRAAYANVEAVTHYEQALDAARRMTRRARRRAGRAVERPGRRPTSWGCSTRPWRPSAGPSAAGRRPRWPPPRLALLQAGPGSRRRLHRARSAGLRRPSGGSRRRHRARPAAGGPA